MIRVPCGLGQSPPGEVTIFGGTPLQNRAECDSFDGQLYSGGTLCCKTVEGKSYCKRTAFGAPDTGALPMYTQYLPASTTKTIIVPNQPISTSAIVGIAAGFIGLVLLTTLAR